MFTVKKLLALPYKTRIRKLILILQKAEIDLANNLVVDRKIIIALLETILEPAPENVRQTICTAAGKKDSGRREWNNIRHLLLHELGCEPAEWDFIIPETGTLDQATRTVFPIRVFLEDIRSPFNVGAIFRTAESFGVEQIYLSQATPLPDHKKAAHTARGAARILPWSVCNLSARKSEPAVFALETGGIPVADFNFPCPGLVLIGSEELGLSPEALELADSSAGRVGIPLFGAKRSLNVSVAFGILMENWCRYLVMHPQNAHHSTA